MSTTIKNPYIGPRTFQKNEGHLFYGREREARDLIALVASERLVVFYAQSGAGKSSIVNTRLIPSLEAKEYEVLPVGRVSGDIADGYDVENIYIYNLLRSLEQHGTDPAVLAKLTLSEFLAHLGTSEKGFFYDPSPVEVIQEGDEVEIVRRAVVIDQFEELFSTHPEAWEKRDAFFQQLAKAMEDDPYLWVVLVMREDYIAALDPYAHHAYNGLRIRYYMQRLERESALKAVTNPVKDLRPYAGGVAEKLIDDLCSITVEKPDGELDVQPGQYVEPVQLQVVCYGLWENLSPEGTQITEKDLEEVGDVNQSLGKYYDRRVRDVAKTKNVRERLIREWIEKKLITAGGIRNMVLQERETKPGELADDVIQALQSDLVRAEKRGGATWYELTHDRLVDPILEHNRIWFNENLSPLQRQATLWNDQEQNETWLLGDHALVELEEWAKANQDELTVTENEFLEACRKKQKEVELESRRKNEEQEREVQRQKYDAAQKQLELANKLATEEARSAQRARRFSLAAGLLVVMALIATASAVINLRSATNSANAASTAQAEAEKAANNAKTQSDIARSSELSTIALDLSDSQLDLALLLGVQADSFDSNSQTQKTMAGLLQKSSRYIGSIERVDDIQSVQYSPDGKTLATLTKDGITLWDAEKRTPLSDLPLNGHFIGVYSLAISKDGSLMASGGVDGTIVIWDVAKHMRLSEPVKAHTSGVRTLAFNPNDKTKLASASDDGIIIFWDITDPAHPTQTGEPLTDAEHPSSIISIAFSPDGTILASGYADSSINLWDVKDMEKMGESLKGHTEGVWSVAFSPISNNIFASGSYDNTVILWDISDPANPQITRLEGHLVDIETIAFSPNGKILASGDDYGNIILWDVMTGKAITDPPLNGQTSWVISLAFSPDGKTLASGSYSDGRINLWDVSEPKSAQQIGESIDAHKSSVWGVVFGVDGKTLISASDDSTILFWDVSKLEKPEKIGVPLRGHSSQPTGMSFSQDGSLLQSYGNDGTVLIDVKGKQAIGMGSVSYSSPDGGILAYQVLDDATGVYNTYIRNTKTGNVIGNPIKETPVFIFSPDNIKFAFQINDADGISQIHLWNVNTNQEVVFHVSSNPMFSPDSHYLFYQVMDQETGKNLIKYWNTEKWEDAGISLEGLSPTITADGRVLVYQTANRITGQPVTELWDLSASQKIGKPIDGSFVTISSDNRTLLSQTYGNSAEVLINLWDIDKGVKIKSVGTSNSLYSQDGRVFAYITYNARTGSPTINVMDTATGKLLIPPFDGAKINALSANGKIMIYATSDSLGNNPSIHAINTTTGSLIGNPITGYFSTSTMIGPVFIYATDYSSTGVYEPKFSLINSSTGMILAEMIPGDYSNLNLVQDGRVLIYQTSNNKLNLVDINQGSTTTLDGTFISVDKDNKVLLYQTYEGSNSTIKLWNIEKGGEVSRPIRGKNEAVSPDGRILVTRSDANSLIFWNVTRTWPFGDPIVETKDTISGAALSSDTRMLAFATASTINVLDAASGAMLNTLSNDHIGTVNSVALSPDKNTLLTFGEDGKAIVWDLATFEPLGEPIMAGSSGSFSPKGKYVVISNYMDNTTTLWDIARRKTVETTFVGQYFIFNPDETYMVIGDGINNTLTLWDLSISKVIGEPVTGQRVVFSPNGKSLAFIDDNNNVVNLWDMSGEKFISDSIAGRSVFFSPDSKTVAVYDDNKSITTLFDLSVRQIVARSVDGSIIIETNTAETFIVNDFKKNSATFWDWKTRKAFTSPYINGSDLSFTGTKIDVLVVRDNAKNRTSLWDPATRLQIGKTLAGIYYPSFSPDNTLISMADRDKNTTVIWNLKTQKQAGVIPGYYNPTFCADNNTVAWYDVTNKKTLVFDLKNGVPLGEIETGKDSKVGDSGPVLSFSPNCDRLALEQNSQASKTDLWDIQNRKIVGVINGVSVHFSPDGLTVAALGQKDDDKKPVITFWRVADATILDLQVPGDLMNIQSDNPNIMVVSYKSPPPFASTIVDMNKAAQIGEIQNSSYYPTFRSKDILIIYGKDGVTLWDVANDKMIRQPLQGHKSLITNMAFSPDGRVLASLASDGVMITNMQDMKSQSHLDVGDYSGSLSGFMTFNSDGTRLSALGDNGTILTWDLTKNPPALIDPANPAIAPYRNYVDKVSRKAFSPDGRYLVYEAFHKLHIWDITKDMEIRKPIDIEVGGGAVTFTPNGNTMFYNDGGTIFRWDDWSDSNGVSAPSVFISSGQNNIWNLGLIMGGEFPRYLIVSANDPSYNVIHQIWELSKGSKVGEPISGDFQVIGSSAQIMIFKNNDGRLVKWNLHPDTWVTTLCARAGRSLTSDEWKQYIGDVLPYPVKQEDAPCPLGR